MLKQTGLKPLPPPMMPASSVMWIKSMFSAMSIRMMSTTPARNPPPLLPRWPLGCAIGVSPA